MGKLTPREQALHSDFTRYGRNAKEWLRKCALLLPKIQATELWRKKGFTSIYHYAAVVAGMNHDQTREALRVMKHIQDKPALLKVAEERGLGAVRPVATVATRETAGFWAKKAEILTVRALGTYVRESRHVETSQPENAHKITLILALSSDLARRLDRVSKRKDFEARVERFLDEVEAEEAASTPEAVAKQMAASTQTAQTSSRHIPAAIRRAVEERTGGLCAWPGCQRPRYQLHHTRRWALKQVHDPNRLHLLCREHNELAHAGLIENEDGRPETWQLRLEPDCLSAKWAVDQKVRAYARAWRGG